MGGAVQRVGARRAEVRKAGAIALPHLLQDTVGVLVPHAVPAVMQRSRSACLSSLLVISGGWQQALGLNDQRASQRSALTRADTKRGGGAT